jgi:membrane-associated phospholipid phosphatase
MMTCRPPCIALLLLISLLTGTSAQASGGVETAGDVLTGLLPVAAAGLTLYNRDRDGALQGAGAAAVTLAVTYGLKYTINESRPDGGSHSFPSAHTSVSFCAAEYLRKRYGWEYGIPAYALASFVAYSRVESDQHYAKDVIAGAAIGIVSSYIFTRPYLGVTVQPAVDAGYYGVRLSRIW